MQNEWYYVWKMVVESDLLERKVTARAFIAQMLKWFLEVFGEMADEEQKKAFVEKLEKSISVEKRKWVQKGQEVPFKDMNHKWPELQLDPNKVEPMFLVCLKSKCKSLKMTKKAPPEVLSPSDLAYMSTLNERDRRWFLATKAAGLKAQGFSYRKISKNHFSIYSLHMLPSVFVDC